jgi:hypothetical protein
MPEPEYITIRCATCGGVAHPATGCAYSPTFVVCGPCTRAAWKWILVFVNGKGARRGPRFYDHVNRVNGILIERNKNMTKNASIDKALSLASRFDGHVSGSVAGHFAEASRDLTNDEKKVLNLHDRAEEEQ